MESFLLGLILTILPAQARPAGHQIEDIYAHRLAHAVRAAEVARLRADYEELRVTMMACQLQIEREDVPVACYKRRRSLRNWVAKDVLEDTNAELDRRCRRATRALRVPGDTINLDDLSADCRGRVAEARRILRYRGDPVRIWSED